MYFPDPWPKNRHRNRRLFRMPYLNALCEKLTAGGLIYFATDFQDYFIQAKVLMLMHPELLLQDSSPPDELNLSLFKQRLTCSGRSVFFTSAAKSAGEAPGRLME
jgi:tRNA (guanine-N7-)-methyltransferase